MNDETPKQTWIQYLRDPERRDLPQLVMVVSEGKNDPKEVQWLHPKATYHLHIGEYDNRKQVTLIADGVGYTREDPARDTLGERVASGQLPAMMKLLRTYAKML